MIPDDRQGTMLRVPVIEALGRVLLRRNVRSSAMARHLARPQLLATCLVTACLAAIPATAFSASPAETQAPPARQVVVYSFHGQFRCWTCLKVEEYARDTVMEHFSDEVKEGLVVFEVIDLSLPENKHFYTDYRLDSWSVALSLRENGRETRSRNLADIQDFVKDRQFFINYLFKELKSFLGGT